MQVWEIVVLIAGIAFVALVVYAIIAIRKMLLTLNKVDTLISENEASVTAIVKNVDTISNDTKEIVTKVSNVVSHADKMAASLKSGGLNALEYIPNVKRIYDVASIAFAGLKIIKSIRTRHKKKKLTKTKESGKRK
ncbi:MAG: DUF948 domain-containing protein [Anaerofustis sp.]